MQHGVITFLNFEKGFGFIMMPDGKEVFFHANQRHPDDYGDPRHDMPISFSVRQGPKGPVAIDWRITPEEEVVIDLERDRREGFRPGVLIAYSLKHFHGDRSFLLGKRRGDWSWLSAAIQENAEEALAEHNNSPNWMYSWGVPQGGIEEGETCEDAIRRELIEELGDYGDWGWTRELTITFLFKERASFRVEKDGRIWNGKALYAFLVETPFIPDEADTWMYGSRGDEFSTLPTPAFEGGIQFYHYSEAVEMIRNTQRGPKGAQLMRLFELAQTV